MAWCEAEDVDYLLGLAKNERLKAEIQDPMAEAEARYRHSGQAARVFHEFFYQTRESWNRARRVVAKAEYLEKGENPRFIVTSLPQQSWPAQPLYEQHYCARGDMENRIKEQLMLFADRTSTAYLRSNQLRLYFSSGLRAVADVAAAGIAGNRVGPRPMRHDSAEAVKDRRSDPHHGTQGVGLPRGWLSLCRVVLADSCQAFCPAAAVLNQPASPKNSLRSHSFGKEGCSVRADLPPRRKPTLLH